MRLTGRSAIITGASIGFGSIIAEHFVAEGAAVLICARDEITLQKRKNELVKDYPNAVVHAIAADVSEREHVSRLFNYADEVLGSYQILVNNAGVCGPIGLTEAVDWDEWLKTVAINLSGAVNCCRQALRRFKPNKYGKIINISGGGATSPLPYLSAYAASKAALVGFTETLARELSNTGIAVNAVAPGLMSTRITDEMLEAGKEAIGQDLHARLMGGIEQLTPHIAANLCVYLASDASDQITGRLIAAQFDPWPFDLRQVSEMTDSSLFTLRRVESVH